MAEVPLLLPTLLLSLTGVGHSIPQASKEMNASELYASCEAMVQFLDTNSPVDSTKMRYCSGYMDSLTDGGQLKLWAVCIKDPQVPTLARSYVQYMQQHTELLLKPRVVGALLALKQEYGCPTGAAPAK